VRCDRPSRILDTLECNNLVVGRIPLERGRDIAVQYGVAPLLAPLFDFTPNANNPGSATAGGSSLLVPHPSTTPAGMGAPTPYGNAGLAPPPIMPGSALRLLNQGRAQGLFTPSTSVPQPTARSSGGHVSPNPYYPTATYSPSPFSGVSTPPAVPSSLKRTRSDESDAAAAGPSQFSSFQTQVPLDPALEILPPEGSRPGSAMANGGEEINPPAKRPRMDPTSPYSQQITWQLQRPDQSNGSSKPEIEVYLARLASKATVPRNGDLTAPLKDPRRVSAMTAICQTDDPTLVLNALRGVAPDGRQAMTDTTTPPFDPDVVLDDQGHTALHLAASMARLETVDALLGAGADVHRGNYLGETALIRACIATHNADAQTFDTLMTSLHASIRTLDSTRKSVLHHVVALAGVKGRAVVARYYLEQIFYWIAQRQAGDFKSLIDLQDEHGDTALNIAARVGNRSLVRTLLDVGANKYLPNKLGLRPGDFGVEPEARCDCRALLRVHSLTLFTGTGRWSPC
jgi:regulatory protein SWI6